MGAINFFTTLLTCKVLDEDKGKVGGKREIPQLSKGNFQYNWIGILIIGVPPLMTLIGLLLGVELRLKTLAVGLFFGGLSGIIGITAGYHRLYSHRAYTAGPFMLKLTAFLGAGAFQGSIKWWARLHRIHHKHVDTDLDPYDARRGFFFTHFGWFCMRMDYDLLGSADTSDLDNHPVVIYQRDNFAVLAMISGMLIPWLACGLLCDDWVGGHFYGIYLKIFITHQVSFCINSLCHTNWFWATQTYNDTITAHDSVMFALVTFGEGYHNYHHAFAQDYRNGHRWYHFDPTKWYIYTCMKLGFCWDLVRVPREVIRRAFSEVEIKHGRENGEDVRKAVATLDPVVTDVMTEAEMHRLIKEEGRRLLIVDGYVLDLDKPIQLEAGLLHEQDNIYWYDAHPGGRKFLDAYMGKDATEAMSGGVYKHSHGAHAYLPELRIAHLKAPA